MMLIGNTANSLRHSHRHGIDKYTLLANQTARKALPTVSGSGISWAICTSLQTDNHANTPPLIFLYRTDALPATQPSASKH